MQESVLRASLVRKEFWNGVIRLKGAWGMLIFTINYEECQGAANCLPNSVLRASLVRMKFGRQLFAYHAVRLRNDSDD